MSVLLMRCPRFFFHLHNLVHTARDDLGALDRHCRIGHDGINDCWLLRLRPVFKIPLAVILTSRQGDFDLLNRHRRIGHDGINSDHLLRLRPLLQIDHLHFFFGTVWFGRRPRRRF
uniref:(northern house mosquito) hypothetical protein n=1 Tax=Culex pipiens TaxID=7175 RepID=A0A8D8DIP9_CULPI